MEEKKKDKNGIINDKLGGRHSLPIKYVRESLRETDNPVIHFLRSYPGQIVMAIVTYYLLKRIVVQKIVQTALLPSLIGSGIVGEDKIVALACMTDIFMLAGFLLYMKFAEGRNADAMGFIRKDVLKNCLLGLLAGFGLFSVTMLISVFVTGGHIEWSSSIAPWFFFVALFCFIIQSSAEEINGRSYIFLSVARKHPDWASTLISGLFFGGIHLTNPGVTAVSTINTVLIGIVFCLLVLLLENLWFVCAMHAGWNFAQGNIYGLLVSGHDAGGSLFRATIESENELLSGGAYGVESNIITTVLFIIVVIALVIMLKNNARHRIYSKRI